MDILKRIIPYLVVLVFLLNIHVTVAGAGNKTGFPLRAKYGHLFTISTQELAAVYDKAIIIDCRYKMEFHVIRMDAANSLPEIWMISDNLLELREKYDERPMVFYGNDPTSREPYRAADKAGKWGFKNVRVYDGGIFQWAENQPHRSYLFKEKLTSQTVASAFIGKERFNNVLLPTREFIERAKSGQYTLLDGREVELIEKKPVKLENLQIMNVELMANLLRRNLWSLPTSDLLVFDDNGETVRWLQYYFEMAGIRNYYFLKGGVRKWFADGYSDRGNKK